jgi:hypothetical protein
MLRAGFLTALNFIAAIADGNSGSGSGSGNSNSDGNGNGNGNSDSGGAVGAGPAGAPTRTWRVNDQVAARGPKARQ